ncbi:MAG: 16S rRNA (guanine(527)-N(7))-methyltransferase RsmG [bacterium]
MSTLRPSPESLKQLLARWGFALDKKRLDQIWRYHTLLRQANEVLNMTRIYNFEAMVLKHYVDCLLPARLTKLTGPLLDMGTGPGLPGIIIKIAMPELPMVLADTRSVRCQFLEDVIRQLGLKEIDVFFGSITLKFVQPMAAVITRAVADIPDTMHRVQNCLDVGGRLILMKGPDCNDEISQAKAVYGDDYILAEDHPYTLPESTNDRRLLVYERTSVSTRASSSSDPRDDTSQPHTRPVREIASTSNPNYQTCIDLQQGKGVRRHELALVSGRKFVDEVVQLFPERVDAWLTDRDGEEPPAGLSPETPWLRFSKPLWQELDQFGTGGPILRIKAPRPPAFDFSDPENQAGCTLLVPFQDPENVGAVLRSAAAFEVDRVVLLQESANPFHTKSLRAGGPGILGLSLFQGPSIRALAEPAIPLVALSSDGKCIYNQPWPESFLLLPGVEGPGLPVGLSQVQKIGIPMAAQVESLNAAVATAITLYDWRRKRAGI